MKILVVEDERDMNRILVRQLKAEHYSVDSCFDGDEALDFLFAATYDVVILDVNLPKRNGFDVLKHIRQQGLDTKVIMLTARDQMADKIYGLDSGADDYLVKPFEFGELLARLRVLVRRAYGNQSSELAVQDLVLDTSKKQVTRNGVVINLTAKEYQVLHYLMQNTDHVLSREQILEHAWDFEYEGESNIIDVIIKNIRKKLADVNPDPIILTKRGIGYVIQTKADN